MFVCLTSARFNMTATVLSQGQTAPTSTNDPVWVERQNPDTGEIERYWQEVDDDPDTAGMQARTIPCIVRGVLDGGIRVAGTTERYSPAGVYENIDFAKMQFPANVQLSKRDRITNIRNSRGELIWKEEEWKGAPTVFDILGVTPIPDPWGTLIENHALLQRSEVQGGEV